MLRNNKVIFVVHCLLNQNCVVYPYARARGAYKDIVDLIIDEGVGIETMPCPETLFSGILREPLSKQQYDTPEYRKHCMKLSETVIEMMKHYLAAGIKIVGVIGVSESGTCDSTGNENGVFMEELKKAFANNDINLDFKDISVNFQEDRDNKEELSDLKNWIREKINK